MKGRKVTKTIKTTHSLHSLYEKEVLLNKQSNT